MATAKSKISSAALSYQTRNLVTIKSSCESLTPIVKATRGRLQIGGEATVEQVADTTDEVHVTYEAKIAGAPIEDPQQVSFTSSCKVGYYVKFDRPQDENLPPELLRELSLPLFYVASERCRLLISSMGYPVKFPPTEFPLALPEATLTDRSPKTPNPRQKKKTKAVTDKAD